MVIIMNFGKKVFLVYIIWVISFNFLGAAGGAPRACADLASYDERQFCWAVQKQEPERCTQISNDQLRLQCQTYFVGGNR